MSDSAARLRALFDAIPKGEPIVVLAHCGPAGLGDQRGDLYGRDFHPDAGDWGDPDLAEALAHAKATDKRVLAVVAGHMHHFLRGGGLRRWHDRRDEVLHVNAARVPRRRSGRTGDQGHHARLTLSEDGVTVEEVWAQLG
jgi:uncharacterized protein (TIGR04168 family)